MLRSERKNQRRAIVSVKQAAVESRRPTAIVSMPRRMPFVVPQKKGAIFAKRTIRKRRGNRGRVNLSMFGVNAPSFRPIIGSPLIGLRPMMPMGRMPGGMPMMRPPNFPQMPPSPLGMPMMRPPNFPQMPPSPLGMIPSIPPMTHQVPPMVPPVFPPMASIPQMPPSTLGMIPSIPPMMHQVPPMVPPVFPPMASIPQLPGQGLPLMPPGIGMPMMPPRMPMMPLGMPMMPLGMPAIGVPPNFGVAPLAGKKKKQKQPKNASTAFKVRSPEQILLKSKRDACRAKVEEWRKESKPNLAENVLEEAPIYFQKKKASQKRRRLEKHELIKKNVKALYEIYGEAIYNTGWPVSRREIM
jgi:hypothetical protein